MRSMIVNGPTAADWRETTIPDDTGDTGREHLAALQAAVGGCIESLPIDDATVFINDSGKIDGLPPVAVWTEPDGTVNDILRGPLVLLGPVDEEGNTTGLTDEALAYVRERVRPLADFPEWAGLEQAPGCVFIVTE